MKKSAVRLICLTGVLVVLACGAYALASGDSLVSLRYLQETFLPQATEQGTQAAEQKLQETYDAAKEQLDQLQSGYLGGEAGGSYSSALQPRAWSDGDMVEIGTGAGLLMLEGAITVTHSGALVDVTDGTEVASGSRLTAGHRYLAGEDTTVQAQVISGAASMGVQGAYVYTAGEGESTPFYDVCQTDWFYAPVSYVYENGLFSGISAHSFGPGDPMNRAMLMTVLYQMAGAPADELQAADVSFSDVPDSAWYASYVKWGASQGITAGTGENTFSPEQQITRQQVVTLLYSFTRSYLGLTPGTGADLSGYQDLDQVSSWALEAMSWAVGQGIVSSSSADVLTLSPEQNANRAEVATMLRAFSEKIL